MVVLKNDSEVAASIANNRTSLLSNASTRHVRDHEYKPSIAVAATADTSSSSSRWTHNGGSSSTKHESFSSVGNDDDYDDSIHDVLAIPVFTRACSDHVRRYRSHQ